MNLDDQNHEKAFFSSHLRSNTKSRAFGTEKSEQYLIYNLFQNSFKKRKIYDLSITCIHHVQSLQLLSFIKILEDKVILL